MNTWKTVLVACLSVLVLGISPAGAAPPRVTVKAATPSAAYQGDILDVVVTGSGFDPSAKVQYFVSGTTNPGGITVRSVKYASSGELVTTIEVSGTANLASFDIQVTLDNGRKGKGTTLFSVRAKPNSTPVVIPTYPPARFWHAFTSNGGESTASSRLYMFGGDGGAPAFEVFNDLWAYSGAGSTNAAWTFVPTGSQAPGPRHHAGWSCGGGYCVLSNGGYVSALKETWVFAESLQGWTQVNCGKRAVCPSARLFATMAHDPLRGTHILFGGSASGTAFNDTFTFNPVTMTWKSNGMGGPSPRSRAAATFVPAIGHIVLFGGQEENVRSLHDMYFWDGSSWTPIQQVVDSSMTAVPSLHSHSIAWNAVGDRMIVTGGYVDANDTPNVTTFYVTFALEGGTWNAAWTRASGIGCQSAAESVPDTTIHAGARMAFDSAVGVQVFFGGVENLEGGATGFGNTVECR